MADTQATSSAKGFIFQAYYALYFLFNNFTYRDVTFIDIEAKQEDVVFYYKDNSIDIIQIKTQEFPKNNSSTFDSTKFNKGMFTLNKSYTKLSNGNTGVRRCIYANNMVNQKIERITNQIIKESPCDFIYNMQNELYDDEKLKLFSTLKFIPDNKFYLARIDDKYFSATFFTPLKELGFALERMGVSLTKIETITHLLKNMFADNSTDRDERIEINQIAWVIIKQHFNYESGFANFNILYAEELFNTGFFGISDILQKDKNISALDSISNHLDLLQHITKLKISYENINGIVNMGNFKHFIDSNFIELENEDYLSLDSSIPKIESNLVYKFLLYYTYFKKIDIEKIYKEFNII